MTPGKRVPGDHPIRKIKAIADAELERLSPVFGRMYSERGRYSIPPERLLKSCLLIALYSVRSERQFCEQLDYNLLFRFFLDMGNDEDAFDASSFAKNRDRLIEHEVARLFFEGVIRQAKESAPDLDRALHGRRDADRRMGVVQELPAEEREGSARRRRPEQPDGRLPR